MRARITKTELGCQNTPILALSEGWGVLSKERDHSREYAETVGDLLSNSGYDATVLRCCDKEDLLKAIIGHDVVVYNSLFGAYGEDGRLPALFEYLGVSYTGCGPMASALAMSKGRCSAVVRETGVQVPEFALLNAQTAGMGDWAEYPEKLLERAIIFTCAPAELLSRPFVVKPDTSAFNTGITSLDTIARLPGAIKKAARHSDAIILQRYISGWTVRVPVLCGQALEPIQSVPRLIKGDLPGCSFRTARRTYLIPCEFPKGTIHELRRLSEQIHNCLGCRGLTRCDFRVTEDQEINFLELNVQHSIRPMSLASQSGMACGLTSLGMVEAVLADRWVAHENVESGET